MSTVSAPRRSIAAPGSEVLPLVPTDRKKGPFYGHATVARTCARFLTHLFACPVYPPSVASSRVELPHFIAYALHRTKLHPSVTFATLMLLQRLKARFPDTKMVSGHRLFITGFMIASKVIYDVTYSNKSWAIVARGMFSLKDINKMEREMCDYLGWKVTFDNPTLSSFETFVTRNFSRDRALYPSYPLSVVSRCARGGASTDTHVVLDSSTATTATTIYGFDQHLGPSPTPPTSCPVLSPEQQTHRVPRSSSPWSLASHTDIPSPSHSNTTSPTTTGPPRTAIGFQGDTARVHGADSGMSPTSSHTPIGLENGSAQIHGVGASPPFTVVDELPHMHPLRGQMFAFAVPSNF